MLGPTFDTETTDHLGIPVVVVTGEVDIKTAPKMQEAIEGVASGSLIVDLNAVDFIDSSGLRTLVIARELVEGAGGTLTLCASEDSVVVRTMRLAGLSTDFHVVPSRDRLAGTG